MAVSNRVKTLENVVEEYAGLEGGEGVCVGVCVWGGGGGGENHVIPLSNEEGMIFEYFNV